MWDQLTQWATVVLKKHESPLALKEASWKLIAWVSQAGQADPVSWIVRPWVAHKGLKRVIGLGFIILIVTTVVWGPVPSLASQSQGIGGRIDLTVLSEGEINMRTTESVRIPIENYHVSQGYWWLHPGMDLAAELGEPVHAVAAGRVEYVGWDRFGYGNHIIINHGEYQSLYGHLSKVEVKEGQEVTPNTEIGLVGSTGHSTGPHLHLEIRENGHTVNPKTILDIK